MKMSLWLEYQKYQINPTYWPKEAPLLQCCSASQAEVLRLGSALSEDCWEIMLFSVRRNLRSEGHSGQRCPFCPHCSCYKSLLSDIFFPRSKHSAYWTKSIEMHRWVCLWMRSWATPALCSCWTQEDAQTPAGYISNDIWGPSELTQSNSPRDGGNPGLRLHFASLVQSMDFERIMTTSLNAQLLL